MNKIHWDNRTVAGKELNRLAAIAATAGLTPEEIAALRQNEDAEKMANLGNLQWTGTQLATRAQGSNSEFVVFASLGKFDLVQRRRVGADSQKKFKTLRQALGLTHDAALRTAQEWEDQA